MDDVLSNLFSNMAVDDIPNDVVIATSDDLPDNIADDCDDHMMDFLNQIEAIDVPAVNPLIGPKMIEVAEFDESNNVLDICVRESFKNECIYEETKIFTRPISTTNTMEGFISNVSFHEQELIFELIPDEEIVAYRCNYGKIKFDGYTELIKQRRTNRGRKKVERKKKPRKKQGTGDDFNSQVTFVARSSYVEPCDGIIPFGTKVYKFKVFRTGKIQLPGVHQDHIEDVIVCAKRIVKVLNFHLHAGEQQLTRMSSIINMNPVMKNYKFTVKLPVGYIINLTELKQILFAAKAARSDAHPPIFMIKYTRQDTKLSIKFSTPIRKQPKKRTRINIFMRGKINILGAFHSDVTHSICDFLHKLIEKNYSKIIVAEGGLPEPPAPTWEANIDDPTDSEFAQIINWAEQWLPDLPDISPDDLAAINKFIDDIYAEYWDVVRQYLLTI